MFRKNSVDVRRKEKGHFEIKIGAYIKLLKVRYGGKWNLKQEKKGL